MTFETGIAEIIGFNISMEPLESVILGRKAAALSASLTLKINGEEIDFGGPDLFSSVPNQFGSDLVSYFMMRCMQVAGVPKSSMLNSELIKAEFDEERVLGISGLLDDDFFYPGQEFELLQKGE